MKTFTLNRLSTVSGAKVRLEDGAYRAKIARLVEPDDKNPYFVLTPDASLNARDIYLFINNDKTWEIITDSINRQLDITEDYETTEQWLDSIIGAEIDIYLWTQTSAEGKQYQNCYLYQPQGFENRDFI